MQGMILNERYRLDQQIGEGGMAVVYSGHDLLLNRQVAVKILRAQYAGDENFLKRFEREGQLAAGMSHPNIVSVYDVGSDQGLHYIVMEHIRGPNLKELIRKQGPFSVDGAVFIIAQVASALDYAHQRNLVHRDIKPQNILVDREGNAKVVDFGIAKGLQDANLTEVGTGMGTVHYVSPEQARGEQATPASDLYSTGIVLYEMLTRSLPFNADTPVGVAMQHVSAQPPRPSTINPAIPPQVEAIVLRAIAKNPADRYPSGAALETALRHWDSPPPQATQTTALPPPPPPVKQQPRQRARQRQPQITRQAPAVPAPNRRQPPPPPRAQQRDEVGCGTWIIGTALLLGVIGFLVIAFQFGPALFEDNNNAPATPTPTEEPAAILPTNTPPPPTPTTPPEEPTPVPPTPTAQPPTETPVPEPNSVPDLVNSSLAEAQTAVGDEWTITVVEEYSIDIEEGLVIRQQPAPGTPLNEGASITLVVSLGPQIVTVPDVRGVPAEQARASLEALGFNVSESEGTSPSLPYGTVIETIPDTSAAVGSWIEIVVNTGDYVEVPNLYAEDLFDAMEMLEDAGLTMNNVTAHSCNFLIQQIDDFDCDTFPNHGVVWASHDWGERVERGTLIDVFYYDESL